MTRIVAGAAGGRTLRVPGKGTRPTSERVREALFSRLEHQGVVDGARVLDLYAGSGALGLEAASRGASAVTLVEAARIAADVCRQNATATRLTGIQVVTERAERYVQRPAVLPWDLVLVDPPYELAEEDLAAVLRALVRPAEAAVTGGGSLAVDSVVVVERSSRSPEPTWPAGIERVDRRAYGETIIWFAAPTPVDATREGTHEVDAADGAAPGIR